MSILFYLLGYSTTQGAIVDVFTFNNEFSINQPGEPIAAPVISAGDSIRWIWLQGGHTTTSVAGSSEVWNTVLDQNNTEFTYQFNTPGVYWYYCIPHGDDNGDGTASGMSGTITVLSSGSGACCLPDATCFDTTEAVCLSQEGVFQGAGTICLDVSCSASVSLLPSKDNILYEDNQDVSNGIGSHLWLGNTNQGDLRRSVLSFDLGSIPINAEITSAQLDLYCNNASGGNIPVNCHLLLSDWGEGTSNANGNEGSGANATINDATWNYAFYNSQFWTNPGGDYDPNISASSSVGAANFWYQWSSPQLLSDVQQWVINPTENFGWILLGDEASSDNGKRFGSKDNSDETIRPVLHIEYFIPEIGACCMSDGVCYMYSENDCISMGGTYQGDFTSCDDTYCSIELTPFIDALPLPSVAQPIAGTPGGTAHYQLSMTEQFQQLHSELPPTRTWGYDGSYPGPTIEAFRDATVTVEWTNDLRVSETGVLRTSHHFPIDTCLHGPNITGQSPVSIVHLHGGKVAPESDGYPDLAFLPGVSSPIYTYPNDQPASTIWYHDHALGITRLNVMMGMAGFYIIRDTVEQNLNLPSGEFEIPLAIQDRSFNPDGSWYYPEEWHDEFHGDKALVNGKVWPFLDVKQGKYRFRLLNGSNSRTYNLSLSDGSTFWLIGTDLGLIEEPVPLTELLITPGERAEILIDFATYNSGDEIILSNDAPAMYPGFPGVGVIPEIMKFVIGSEAGFTDPIPTLLTSVPEILEQDAITERTFEFIQMPPEDCGEHEHGMWTINGLMWDDITEFPLLGTTEIWTWVNTSGMTHPMHMHLVAFQVLDRTPIDANGNPTGPAEEPGEHEKGWKDTVNSLPGYKTRVIMTFDSFTGLYPYHCHILEHEDHEMMRQFEVLDPTVYGCTDISACNFNPLATANDGSCFYNCEACIADLSGDGVVDTQDLLAFLSHFGCALPDICTIGDFNEDENVNVQDLLFFLSAFGEICDE
jgi:spore coat protein A